VVSDRNIKPTLDEVLPVVEDLPVEEKAKLIQRLIGKQSGLSVVLGSSHLHDSIIGLISMMSRDELSEILKAVAQRITSEGT
jgi:hypothetical protein